MGNRAVITFDQYDPNNIGLYLHWNGGRDSVEGFLQATRELMQGRLGDRAYGKARLTQVIGTFMGGNLSFGMDLCKNLDCDNYDNGVYIVDSATMEIIGREFKPGIEQDSYKPDEIAEYIKRKLDAAAAIEE